MAVNFPTNPSDGDTVTVGTKTYSYSTSKGVWKDIAGADTTQSILDNYLEVANSSSIGVTTYSALSDLPLSGQSTGKMAYVSGTNRLYLWAGSGWYNIALVNTDPSISGASSTYNLDTGGANTVVTLASSDPEGLPISFSLSTSGLGVGANAIATVTQSNNLFTFTPTTNTALAGTFTATFTASDGVNVAVANSSFTLAFTVNNSNYTTALITSVGSNNQVNDTFVDSSTNSHTITAAGNATQSTFSPYRHGGYSIFCDGVNVMNLGFSTLNSGNWTFECWARVEVGETILGKYGGGNQLEAFGVSGTTGYMYTHTNVGVETPTCNTDLRDGKWHYLVWERYNGTYYYWADGSLETSFSNSETPGATGNWVLGGVASSRFKGNIKEARFSLSTAVYSGSAPTTPTEPQTTSNATDAFFTGVGLEIKDYSSNNRSFTVPSTFITAPSSPYDYSTYSATDNGGSMYFDGTGDYLAIPDNSAFDFGTDPFTIEAWINNDTTRGNYDRIVAGGTQADGANNQWFVGFWPGAQINVGYYNGSSYTETQFNVGSMPNEVWHHLAIVRNGTNVECFFNGVSKGTWNVGTSTAFNTGAAGLIIGHRYSNGSPIEPFHGYISDLRIVKGTAVYTSAFTPPTEPLTAITNTSLLLSGTNAGIIDKSQSVKTMTLTGGTKSSTTQSKYLTSSIFFDGVDDMIQFPRFDVGASEDFTIEFWHYLTARVDSYPAFFGNYATWTTGTLQFFAGHGGSTTTQYQLAHNGSFPAINAGTVNYNQWVHVAIVRYNGTITVYIDGTSIGTVASSVALSGNGTNFFIGRSSDTADGHIQGYLSDFRITQGLARYTANFTPPTSALLG